MKNRKQEDFLTQTLKLLEGIRQVVSDNQPDKKHAPFSLYRRETAQSSGGRKVYRYYVQFWDAENHVYRPGRTTGQTSRAAAFAWAMAELGKAPRAGNQTWGDACWGMFDPGSDFLAFYQPLKRSFGEVHRKHCKNYLEHYLLPMVGTQLVAEADARWLQGVQSTLLRVPVKKRTKAVVGARQERERSRLALRGDSAQEATISANTVGKIMTVMRLMVKWANQKGELTNDPFVGFIPASVQSKRRGVFEPDEIRRLFQLGTEAWPDARLRVFSLVAAVSALRSGEIQGLLRSSVRPFQDANGKDAAVLEIKHSWSQTKTLKSPKNGKTRRVTIPWFVYAELKSLMESSPYKGPEDYIFYQANRNVPVSAQMISEHFSRAVRALGISESERKTRALTFHSFRHGMNSHLVESGIPLLRIQAMVGHNSQAMTTQYFHERKEFGDILKAQEEFFNDPDTPSIAN